MSTTTASIILAALELIRIAREQGATDADLDRLRAESEAAHASLAEKIAAAKAREAKENDPT